MQMLHHYPENRPDSVDDAARHDPFYTHTNAVHFMIDFDLGACFLRRNRAGLFDQMLRLGSAAQAIRSGFLCNGARLLATLFDGRPHAIHAASITFSADRAFKGSDGCCWSFMTFGSGNKHILSDVHSSQSLAVPPASSESLSSALRYVPCSSSQFLRHSFCIGSRRFRWTECSVAVVVDDAPCPCYGSSLVDRLRRRVSSKTLLDVTGDSAGYALVSSIMDHRPSANQRRRKPVMVTDCIAPTEHTKLPPFYPAPIGWRCSLPQPSRTMSRGDRLVCLVLLLLDPLQQPPRCGRGPRNVLRMVPMIMKMHSMARFDMSLSSAERDGI